MKTKKLFIAMVIVGVLLAPVLGLSAELKIGLQAEPNSMDPHYHNLTPNNMMAKYTFDSLIIQDNKQNLKPGLAVSWKPINDLTWEFKLRRDVKFHDGSPFTAEDVKFTMERAPNVPNSPSSFGRFINHVQKIEIVDPHTVRLTTADPFPLMAAYMSGFTIISKKHGEGAATKDYNSGKAMVGTGPYKFMEWIPGDRIVYTRNDDYWGDKPETGTALIWITHDLTVVAGLADHICVMYAGRIVEDGSIDDVLDRPLHPYSSGLIGSVPSRNKRGNALYQIPGMTPSLLNLPEGCAFRERCPRADNACLVTPEITRPVPGRRIRCFHPFDSEAS